MKAPRKEGGARREVKALTPRKEYSQDTGDEIGEPRRERGILAEEKPRQSAK